jgi:hypothetical protein
MADELLTGKTLHGPKITVKMAKAEDWFLNTKLANMTSLMLRYRSAAFFIRTCAPEIAMGLQIVDEIRDTYEVAPSREITTDDIRKTGFDLSSLQRAEKVLSLLQGQTEELLPPTADL